MSEKVEKKYKKSKYELLQPAAYTAADEMYMTH